MRKPTPPTRVRSRRWDDFIAKAQERMQRDGRHAARWRALVRFFREKKKTGAA